MSYRNVFHGLGYELDKSTVELADSLQELMLSNEEMGDITDLLAFASRSEGEQKEALATLTQAYDECILLDNMDERYLTRREQIIKQRCQAMIALRKDSRLD